MSEERSLVPEGEYQEILTSLSSLLDEARRTAARAVNSIMTATYWEVGRRIVEHEQAGQRRAKYGTDLLNRLADDLSLRFGRGFSRKNLSQMTTFYLDWKIWQTVSAKSELPTRPAFPLPWSHYVWLMSVKNSEARAFYQAEALRGGWTVRQLERQINSQF